MCGISGIAGTRQPVAQSLQAVRLMGRYQHHRGPDAWGEWTGDGVVLGHNRLAILDLAGGSQPMACASGEHVIVFNGEIYNFREIRSEIRAAGGVLRTDHSDTEAIVEGYRLWGERVFARLDGMFACAIWTISSGELVLARDRLGIKPAYYCRTRDGGLAFASEPKALVGARLVESRLERAQLAEYFLFRAALHPGTMFAGIRALEPGGVLSFDTRDGRLAVRRFAGLPDVPRTEQHADETEVREALDAAVRSHLVADVEVGVFLSGGVDSSIVAALAARRQRIRAFNVSTGGPLDELPFATRVAGHVGADLHSRRVTPAQMIAAFDDWAYFNDDPVADPSALALMLLAEDVHAHGLKVMLSGEGADELFGGYRSYLRHLAARQVTGMLGNVPGLLSRFAVGPTREYLADASRPFQGTAHLTTREMRQQLLGDDPDSLQAMLREETQDRRPLRHAMRTDQRLRLPSDLLMRTDRATMAWSIEARVPMLANEVLAVSWRLRERDLCQLLPPRNKPLLKRIAGRLVPRDVVYRRKVGFDLPLRQWLVDDFRPQLEALIEERRIPALDYGVISIWYADLRRGAVRMEGVLWAWFVLEAWHRRWVERVSPPRVQGSAPVG